MALANESNSLERLKLEKRLDRYTEMLADKIITPERYLVMVEKTTKRLNELSEPTSAGESSAPYGAQPSIDEFIEQIGSLYVLLSAGQQLEPDLTNRAVRYLFPQIEWNDDHLTRLVGKGGVVIIDR